MDTIQNIITPRSTPSQVNRQDENKSINTTKDIPVVDNQVCKEVITSDTIQKVVQQSSSTFVIKYFHSRIDGPTISVILLEIM
jgi:hypothetical protein